MRSESTAKRTAVALFATVAVGATAAGLSAGVAQAQYGPPAPPFVVSPWNGAYVGLNAGVAGGADAISESGSSTLFGPFGFSVQTSGSGTMTARGFTGGGLAGYSWQSGGWMTGVEADVSYIGLKGSQDMAASNFTFITEHDSFETTWLATVRARVGYAWGSWLFYATGGPAFGDHKYDGMIRAFGSEHPSGSVVKVGFTVGLGTEWMFAPGWTAKLEYLFADLGSETFTANASANKVSVTGHLTEDMIRLGVNYQLGW